MSEWISVTERLPEEHTPVLVSLVGEKYPFIAYYWKPEQARSKLGWHNEDGEDFFLYYEEEVTAWMPLPEKYKENDNE